MSLKDPHEIVISTRDAAALEAVLRERKRSPYGSHAMRELEALLGAARIVAPVLLPRDRVAIGSTVTYREEPAGVVRIVTLCHPAEADGSLGRLPAVSPAGLALLGRRPGSVVLSSQNGWPFSVHVLDVEPAREEETPVRENLPRTRSDALTGTRAPAP
ncbi:MAG TPA: GreA/GreB family elongation factor [Burkholderiales bacterium]